MDMSWNVGSLGFDNSIAPVAVADAAPIRAELQLHFTPLFAMEFTGKCPLLARSENGLTRRMRIERERERALLKLIGGCGQRGQFCNSAKWAMWTDVTRRRCVALLPADLFFEVQILSWGFLEDF